MYLILVIDWDGLSGIVALFIMVNETKTLIESTVNVFKKYKES